MSNLLVISHRDCAAHDPVPGHPERPERLRAVLDGLARLDDCDSETAVPATREQLLRVHDAGYVDRIERIEQRIRDGAGVIALDADTHIGTGSVRAALLAAGAACRAAGHCIDNPGNPAFAVVRPPGHHAEPGRATGFCLFNSVAVAAAHALATSTIRRVAICDFDVHHGNGTEAMFAGRDDVLFASSHQMPLYPGTGDPDHPAAPNIHNAALAPGAGSDEFRAAWRDRLLDAVDQFAPDLVLISAGFDAHRREPLAHVDLEYDDYRWIGLQLKALADTRAAGRLPTVLEGGYDLEALREGALAFAEGITLAH